MTGPRLRQGFTTGTASAAAAKAALIFLVRGVAVQTVDVPLPAGGRMDIDLKKIDEQGEWIRASVIKDAGDDPDVTHKAEIVAYVRLQPGEDRNVEITGGKGVGRVTKPGLPVPVGETAINPSPRKQIEQSVLEVLQTNAWQGKLSIRIEVPKGEDLARKTLNPRLGILGGISILGTRGTVKPFSRKSYQNTITAALDVAQASGLKTIVLSTGGRSERFVMDFLGTKLSEASFVQVADFFQFSLKNAAKRGFTHIIVSCFFGKLVKMAQGNKYTHARKSRIDFSTLAQWCRQTGINSGVSAKINNCNTALQALQIIQDRKEGMQVLRFILDKALNQAKAFSADRAKISYYLFDFNGNLLCRRQRTEDRI